MARKKIITDENANVVEVTETGGELVNLQNEVDAKLEEAKGKFAHVAVVGVREDGTFDLITNVTQYSYIQWMLNKGSFELFIHEKSANQKAA